MRKELLAKIEEAINEPIVGNYIFSDEELGEIYERAGLIFRSFGVKTKEDMAIVFIALVNVTKSWNSDEDRFLNYVSRKIAGSSQYGFFDYNMMMEIIRRLKSDSHIYMVNSGKKYYATICSHALAPISSTESFFDMCWEIYSNDLNEMYSKNDPVFKTIVDILRNKFGHTGSLDEDIKLGSKTYSMRVGLKGLAIYEPDIMRDFLDDTIEMIDMLFNNQPVKIDKYYKQLLNEWWKKKLPTFGVIRRRQTYGYRERIVTDYSQIKPKYILDNGVVKLVIPPIRLISDFFTNPIIEIYVDGKRARREVVWTYGSGIIMATPQKEYSLNDLKITDTINVSVVISHGGKVIHDSETSLCRDFILFDGTKEITASEYLPGIYFLYTPDYKKLLRCPDDIHRTTAVNTYSFEARDGDVLQSNSKTIFFFNEQTNRELYFFVKKNNDAVFIQDGNEYQLIDGDLYVDVKEIIDIKDIGVRYENVPIKLSEFPNAKVDDVRRYSITTILDVGHPQRITIFKYSDNKIIASIDLIKFKNISIKYDRPYYFGGVTSGTVSFDTEKYHLKESFPIDGNEVTIPLEKGEIVFKPPFIKWQIDNGEWHYKTSEAGVWIKEFTNSSIIHIDAPKDLICDIVFDNGARIERLGMKNDFKLGQTIYSIHETKPSVNYEDIFVLINKEQKLLIARIYINETFIDKPIVIDYDKKIINWLPNYFIGDEDAKFVLTILERDKIVKEIELTTQPLEIDCKDIWNNNYIIKLVLIGKGFLSRKKEMLSFNVKMGIKKDLVFRDKIISINHLMLSGNNEKTECKNFFVNHIVYIGTKDGTDFYKGSLYYLGTSNRELYKDVEYDENFNRVLINPVRLEILGPSMCIIKYGLDAKNPDLDPDKYKDFMLYNDELDIFDGKAIDFYYYEVK